MTVASKLTRPFRIIWSLIRVLVKPFFPPKPKDISGKVVLITGGARGIGQHLAYKFASCGAQIALVDLNEKGMLETKENVERSGIACRTYKCDVSNREEVAKLGAEVRRNFGSVDILVNIAGVVCFKNILEITDSEIKHTIEVNLFGTIWMTREFLPEMATRNDGHIVNMSSVLGYCAAPLFVDYCASKYGVNGFSEALASDLESLGKTGIHTSIIYPAAVDTPMVADFAETAKSVLGILLKPEFVAEKIVKCILINKRHIYVPDTMWRVGAINNLFPIETVEIINEN